MKYKESIENTTDLLDYIDMVKRNDCNIDIVEIYQLMHIWLEIICNQTVYDGFKPAKQIYNMWNDLLEYQRLFLE